MRSWQSKAAEDTTFECYYADTAKPLDDVGVSNIFKKKTSAEEAASVSRSPRLKKKEFWGDEIACVRALLRGASGPDIEEGPLN